MLRKISIGKIANPNPMAKVMIDVAAPSIGRKIIVVISLLLALFCPSAVIASSFSDLVKRFAKENNIQMEINFWGENKDKVSYEFPIIPFLTYFKLLQVVKDTPTFSGISVLPRWQMNPKTCSVLFWVKKSWLPIPAIPVPFLEAQEKLFSQATWIDELIIQDNIMTIRGTADTHQMAYHFLATVRKLPFFESAALTNVREVGDRIEFAILIIPGNFTKL